MTKFGPVKTDHILYCSRAFTQSSPSDLMPELQVDSNKSKIKRIWKEDFVRILTEVEYNLLDQYTVAMLATDNVELTLQRSYRKIKI